MSNVIHNTANASLGASAATAATGAVGTMTNFIESNYLLITVTIAFISLLIGLTFHIINWIINQQRDRFERQVKLRELRTTLEASGKTEDEIDLIMNTLTK